ncbi:MFS transporter [Nonomuraea sp. NPDC049141]|uniref:MFS transporter n=1 Tax=Nonomuraea sp. NPDC049141 TaxID=3155500 RepID=UPI0033E21D20
MNQQSAPAALPATVSRATWFALVILLAGVFMALLDTTIVNVSIPTIRTSLGASESTLSWVISGYALAYGLALIPAGRVGDRYGHKWVFIAGLALFTVASLACGLAQNDVQLIALRVVQGLAGGIFFTPVTALIQLMFPGRLRGKAFAIMGATIGFSTALGPLTGGLIIEAFGADDGWRWVFEVNLPIGVVAVVAAFWLLPSRAEGSRDTGTDWIGLVLIAGGLVALLVPLIQGQDQGWPEWTYLSMAGGVALIVGFAFWERRVARLGGRPLVPPHLFVHASFTGGVVLAFVYFAAFTSIFFSVALLWQAGLGASALQSGLVVLPFAIGSIIGASQSDQLASRFGRTVLLVGLGLVAVGIIAIWLVLVAVAPTSLHGWYLTVPLLLGGVGSGMFIAPNADFIVATVDRAEAGAASGVIGTVQRIGSAVGIAVTGSVLFGNLDFSTPGPDAAAIAFAHGATYAMGVSAGFAVLAFALGFTLPKKAAS